MKPYFKKRPFAVIIVIVFSLLILGSYLVVARAADTTYYVDCAASSNGDGSLGNPWNNLATINATTFSAGDSILFKRNTTCNGQLWPKGSGTLGSPIMIGAYDTGPLPIIDGGSNDASVKLDNQEYWQIREIEVVGGTTFGIFIGGDGSNMLHHFRITDVVVHDVYGGSMTTKTTGLIVFGYSWLQHFDDVIIDGVQAYSTDMWAGIVITGKDWKWQTTRSNNITVRNSTVYNTYGDGIVVFSANNVLLENNVAYQIGQEPTQTIGTPNAIWTWDCSNCVVQFNEAYSNSSPGVDGGAFDIDYYSSDTTIQYNYGHDNDAYCIAIFATDGTVSNNTIRYNVCSNNAQEAGLASERNAELYFAVWDSGGSTPGYVEDTHVYNNTIYWNPANATNHYAIASYDLWNGCCFSGSNQFMNNIIYADNPNLVKMQLSDNILFDYNLYWYAGAGDPEFVWGSDTYSGFSAFQTGSGQEAHGLYADPMLVDPTYSDNGFSGSASAFALQSNSPAIDAGADLVALGHVSSMGTQDFAGSAIPYRGAYDIGAVEHLNYAPIAVNDTYTTTEDVSLNVIAAGVLANDFDGDGDVITAVLSSDVSTGTLLLNPDGSFNYGPALNFCGTDNFTYYATDGQEDSNTAVAALNVICVNDIPVAVDDVYSTTEDLPFTTGNVLANDSDPEGQALSVVGYDDGGLLGVLSDNGNGTFDYDPGGQFEILLPGEQAYEVFSYVVSDGVLTDTATVTITVQGVNDAPVAADDTGVGYTTTEDLSFTTGNVLANDSDPESQTLSVVGYDDNDLLGMLIDNGDGTFDYDPDGQFETLLPGEVAYDAFTYVVSDGVLTDTAIVTITIRGVNDGPVVEAGPDQTVSEGNLALFPGLASDPGLRWPQEIIEIHWAFGDGMTITGTLTPTHTYADDGIYAATLTVTDTHGASASDWLLVTVENVAPSLSPLPDQAAFVGETITVTGTITDPGILDSQTVVITWADGFTETLQLNAEQRQFMAAHTYTVTGAYTVMVRVADKDGGWDQQDFIATITWQDYWIYLPVTTR